MSSSHRKNASSRFAFKPHIDNKIYIYTHTHRERERERERERDCAYVPSLGLDHMSLCP
eukprot:COSAG06_NODE_2301_length_7120_cov_3.535251_1_plen_59_part_00